MKSKDVFVLILILVVLGTACQRPARFQLATLPNPAAGVNISPGNYTLTLGPDGDVRDVILHIPPAYDANSQLPLAIVLHGGGGSGSQVQHQSDMDRYADDLGFVVAYPKGSGRLTQDVKQVQKWFW